MNFSQSGFPLHTRKDNLDTEASKIGNIYMLDVLNFRKDPDEPQ